MGTAVSQGQSLFSLEPLQTKDDFALGPAQRDQLNTSRITVEQSAAALQGRIEIAKAELKAAKIEQDRAVQLYEQKVGSRRMVDQTTARVKMAEETLKAAERERKTLRQVDRRPQEWSPAPLPQRAPITGTILRTPVPPSSMSREPLVRASSNKSATVAFLRKCQVMSKASAGGGKLTC